MKSVIDKIKTFSENNRDDWFKFEREGLDFPFYNNNPHISKWKWVLFLLSPLIVLIFTPPIPYLDRAIGFILILLIFGYITKWKYELIFKKIQKRDLKLIVLLVIVGFFLAMAMYMIVTYFGIVGSETPVYEDLESLSYWVSFPFDIFIEEFVKLIPFLAILTLSFHFTKKRKLSIVIATIITLIIFGLLHTDNSGSIVIALAAVGIPSVVDVFAYLKTKNIVITYLTHLIFDILLFALAYFGTILFF